ncbi:winged helix-turn-helix transcriptional regulator [Thalassomonas actiniarum]|uniref:Helix-turn-helix transcriptional regulator n=1 Tax=Thalassomonas actiniarum TaxID=485447 RepID=A0AAE9YVZ9_9GAMM|nr:helix-turn-helix domain-containing protein [Thalassomonas actiniarum]WDE00578.1 helix-turn-helix transcriptional regulator [Thalassomonas actiniarum]
MKKRTYQQNCYLAQAGDFLGERWTLLIFRELLIQPCRFKELNTYLAGMGTNLLSQRLKELEQCDMVAKLNPEDKRSAYRLTEKGRELEGVILELIRWGAGALPLEKEGRHFHHWDLLAMKALFSPRHCRAGITIQFACEELTAWVATEQLGGAFALNFAIGMAEDADIELAMTIADFQQQALAGKYHHDARLNAFIACFNP